VRFHRCFGLQLCHYIKNKNYKFNHKWNYKNSIYVASFGFLDLSFITLFFRRAPDLQLFQLVAWLSTSSFCCFDFSIIRPIIWPSISSPHPLPHPHPCDPLPVPFFFVYMFFVPFFLIHMPYQKKYIHTIHSTWGGAPLDYSIVSLQLIKRDSYTQERGASSSHFCTHRKPYIDTPYTHSKHTQQYPKILYFSFSSSHCTHSTPRTHTHLS